MEIRRRRLILQGGRGRDCCIWGVGRHRLVLIRKGLSCRWLRAGVFAGDSPALPALSREFTSDATPNTTCAGECAIASHPPGMAGVAGDAVATPSLFLAIGTLLLRRSWRLFILRPSSRHFHASSRGTEPVASDRNCR